MKIVFIQPNSPFVSESIPLGLGYIAAICKNYGAEVKIIDGTAPYAKYTDEDMINICKEFQADAIGIVFMTSHIYKAHELTKKFKELNVPLLGGGYHATHFPEELLERGIDIVMRGETDKIIIDIIDYLNKKKKLEQIKGISYKKEGKIINNSLQEKIKDLDNIPLPDREAFKLEDFARSEKEIKNVMSTIITSRGCPYSCIFCASQKTGYRYRSAPNIIKEIRQIKEKYGTINFYFVDDTINIHRQRLINLCKELKKENIIWRCNGRIDLLDEELLSIMKESGCACISFGIESGDDDILKRINKNLTVSQIKEKVKLVYNIGIDQTLNFMLGFPFEEPKHIENTIKLIKELEPYAKDLQRAGLLIPFPGTPIYEEFKNKYKYNKWWLKPQEYMTEVRQSEYRPIYKKFLFDDLGLLKKQGKFFKYDPKVKKKIIKSMKIINNIIIERKAKALNFTNFSMITYLILGMIKMGIIISKGLYKINPKIERKIIHNIYYKIRQSKYYLRKKQF